MPEPCRITVVTATFNAATQLPLTLASMRAQRFPAFEWLVVDGGSSDGTVELLRDNADLIDWWISEPDRGIYDAWNKACARVRGEWVLFIGAGDRFVDADVLGDAAMCLLQVPPEVDLAYGQQQWVSAVQGRVLETIGQPWEEIRHRWEIGRPALPPHGATFQRRRVVAGDAPFDLRFPIAADSHFLLRHRVPPPVFLAMPVTETPIGGVSLRLESAFQVARELRAINRELGLRTPWPVRLREFLRLSAIAVLLCLPARLRDGLADGARALAGKPRRWSVL